MKTESKSQAIRTFLLGGLLPVVLFTVVEEYYGPVWGVVAAMIFGVAELVYEKFWLGKIEQITLWSNGLVLGLGAVSIFAGEGIWFKMQPTILEIGLAAFLAGFEFRGKSFFAMMAEKQGRPFPPQIRTAFKGITYRLCVFLLLHAALSAWAAVHWTTAQWAMLKGLGFTLSLLVYMAAEMLLLQRRFRPR